MNVFYTSMAYLLVFISLTVLLFSIMLVPSEPAVYKNCTITPDKYTPNSSFHRNLKIVLNDLTSASTTTNLNFYNSSFGLDNDTVYGLYLCRGDLSPDSCSSCITNATQSIVEECPGSKESIQWFDLCMLRYANRNIFSKEEESPKILLASSFITSPPPGANEYALPEDFTKVSISKIVYDLINATAFGDSTSLTATRFFSTREDNMTRSWYSLMVYSLAQCTPEISEILCRKCLAQAYTYVEGIIEATVYLPSCHLRYADYKFYNSTNLKSPSPVNSLLPSGNQPTSRDQFGEKNQRGSSNRVVAIVAPLAIVTVLLIFALCIFLWKRKINQQKYKDDITTMESLQYDINTILAAVNNFSEDNKLGKGGFGDVYKGRLQNGQEIAVKRLSPKSKQGIQEFKTEVVLVAKLQHRNLVRLLGFCATSKEKLLIYEYLPCSSLDRLLFDLEKRSTLDWEIRFKIIDGVARGLQYLHQDSRYKIVHRDLKPSNILLDKDMTPKISDFGMAKLFGEDQTQGITEKLVGTLGYMAPEYIRSRQLSTKADVYSFGVFVLEIVSGRRIRGRIFDSPEQEEGLLQYAWRLWLAEKPLELMDSALCGKFSPEEARQCIYISLLCTQQDPEKRPTMASIISMISSHSSNNLPQLQDHLKSENSMSSEWLFQSNKNNTYTGTVDMTTLEAR